MNPIFKKIKLSESTRAFLSRWLMSPLQGITFSYWVKALVDNRFRVSPVYWPRAFLTTLASIKNSLEARQKENKYGPAIRSISVHRPIFILGHYRSGTTHLHNLFAVDQRMAYPNYLQATHPRTFMISERKIFEWASSLTPAHRPYDNVKLGLAVPAEDELALCNEGLLSMHMAWHFPKRSDFYERYLTFEEASPKERELWKQALVSFAKKLSFKYPGKQLVFKSPCHTARIPLILEAFPDALFINIHRDPYRVFASTRYMEINARPLFAYQKYDFRNLDPFIFRRYRKMYESYFKNLEKIPSNQFHEIAYRKLDRYPLETMQEIYHALGLPDFQKVRGDLENYLTPLKNYQKNQYPDLEAEIKAKIQQEWGFCFRAWNYSTDTQEGSENNVRKLGLVN